MFQLLQMKKNTKYIKYIGLRQELTTVTVVALVILDLRVVQYLFLV